MRVQQHEVLAFLGSNLQPIAVVRPWHIGETPDRIECKVDGVEFDVGNRVHQGGVAFGGKGAAPGHGIGLQQHGRIGTSG